MSVEDRAVGVELDAILEICSCRNRPANRLRLVIVQTRLHHGSGHDRDGVLRLLINRAVGLAACLIALIYRHRWMIEAFFRFVKHILGRRHLSITGPRGMETHAYGAVIVCLLIALGTHRKPTRGTYEMRCVYLMGCSS